MNFIYLTCFDGSEGYFTHILVTSEAKEVCLHPSKVYAFRFTSKKEAFTTAAELKRNFKCIKSYTII